MASWNWRMASSVWPFLTARRRGCCGPRRNPVSGGWPPGIGGSPRRIWPLLIEGDAEIVWVSASSGFKRMASRYWLIASSIWPFLSRAYAEVVMGVGVIRFQAEASWYWRIASSISPFLPRATPRLLWCVGVIRFEADGFLVLADGLVGLAFLVEGAAEVIVVRGHCSP